MKWVQMNSLRRCATAAWFNRLAVNEVGAIEFAVSLRYRCLLQMDKLQQMKWVLLNSMRPCATAAYFKWISCKWSGCYWIRCFAAAALSMLASNRLAATNEVAAIESAASLPLRYPCLLQMDCVAALPLLASNGLAANEVGAIEFAASLRYRCATAACFKSNTCNKWFGL
jgi:hypothetical protein